MKAVKIPTNEKELKEFIENYQKYAEKRGVRVYMVLCMSPYIGATYSLYPNLKSMLNRDVNECVNFVTQWKAVNDDLTKQMMEIMNEDKGEMNDN